MNARLRRWLWTWRWPGFPLTLVAAITVALHFHDSPPPGSRAHDPLDTALVLWVVGSLILMLFVVILGTREWSERSTGILLFGVGDLVLYGVFLLPPQVGLTTPWFATWQDFLRANLMVGPPLLILSYSDWLWEKFALWRHRNDPPQDDGWDGGERRNGEERRFGWRKGV